MSDTQKKDAGPGTQRPPGDSIGEAGLFDQQRGLDQSDLPSINASMIEVKGEADSRMEDSQSVNSIQFEVPAQQEKTQQINATRVKQPPRRNDEK